jgi:hypothetical protein
MPGDRVVEGLPLASMPRRLITGHQGVGRSVRPFNFLAQPCVLIRRCTHQRHARVVLMELALSKFLGDRLRRINSPSSTRRTRPEERLLGRRGQASVAEHSTHQFVRQFRRNVQHARDYPSRIKDSMASPLPVA